jgi:GH24 family phage-related lysozyme (muramidase)
MMIAVEGYANNIFPDTRNNATGGIGLTVSFDENGNERKLNLGEADWSDKKVIEQKWMYMEKHMLPIIASIDKKCLDEEILATIGAGFCWGPTNLRNSEYLKSVKQGDSVDVLTRKLTGLLGQMVKTMGQAAMWSVAYGALNAITETFTKAIDYTKDLNRALNDIQIVTGMSTAQLGNFADKAMKAARALNTTSTEYAKAALIFY